MRGSASERFDAKVMRDPNSGCWLWTGSSNKKGYGKYNPGGGPVLAHRFSFKLHNRALSDSDCVLHRCDTPACVNPDHLFLGSRADNAADMVRKGRQPRVRGEACGMAALNEAQARAIKADPRIHRLIAADYGIRKHTVSRIKSGARWPHIA
jgi:hypothetical protein